jgi:hypothetical protein
MAPISARHPASLPPPEQLRRRCDALARLDRALDPAAKIPTHDFDRRAGVFWLTEPEGNYVQISFTPKGVVILGFDHDSPMSPARNDERIWPGVVDELPDALRPVLADYPYRPDITFCIWRLSGDRRWRAGAVRRPRGRDADGSEALLAILDGNPNRYRRFARFVHERDVPLAVIRRAYAGGPVDGAALALPSAKAPTRPRTRPMKRRYSIGDQIVDPWGHRGTITGFWNGLDEAAAAGELSDVSRWLRGLSIKPKTPRKGVWYSVRPSAGGAILAGERDLRPVDE